MVEKDDWRLHGQATYLLGVTLYWREWALPKENPDWDHDHCSFCWKKFMATDGPGIERQGYTTEDGAHWICRDCYQDFSGMFQWKLGPN